MRLIFITTYLAWVYATGCTKLEDNKDTVSVQVNIDKVSLHDDISAVLNQANPNLETIQFSDDIESNESDHKHNHSNSEMVSDEISNNSKLIPTNTDMESIRATTNPQFLEEILGDIYKNGFQICSGVFYRQDLVLTIATYVQVSPTILTVKPSGNQTVYPVQVIHFHPKHNWNLVNYYSFAVVKLQNRPSTRTSVVIDTTCQGKQLLNLQLIGWGYEPDSLNQFDQIMQNITLSTLLQPQCQELHRKRVDSESEFCMGNHTRNNRASYVLSGSPVLLPSSQSEMNLVGLSSWSETSLDDHLDSAPPVFISLCAVQNWLTEIDQQLLNYAPIVEELKPDYNIEDDEDDNMDM